MMGRGLLAMAILASCRPAIAGNDDMVFVDIPFELQWDISERSMKSFINDGYVIVAATTWNGDRMRYLLQKGTDVVSCYEQVLDTRISMGCSHLVDPFTKVMPTVLPKHLVKEPAQ